MTHKLDAKFFYMTPEREEVDNAIKHIILALGAIIFLLSKRSATLNCTMYLDRDSYDLESHVHFQKPVVSSSPC